MNPDPLYVVEDDADDEPWRVQVQDPVMVWWHRYTTLVRILTVAVVLATIAWLRYGR